jgi:hypothetical protein
VHRVLGDRLHCVFVDHGLLRYKVRQGNRGKVTREEGQRASVGWTGVLLAVCSWSVSNHQALNTALHSCRKYSQGRDSSYPCVCATCLRLVWDKRHL